MPELPEVETVRRGIEKYLVNQQITRVIVRERRLRWPIPAELPHLITKHTIHSITRRGKYLLLNCEIGHLLIHLGMSGQLRLVNPGTPIAKHDHVDIELSNNFCLRYTDPRRFGSLLWLSDDPNTHPLLQSLGPEPLSKNFNGKYLMTCCHKRKTPIKNLIMNSHIVVGVGNIYANEALFAAGIAPKMPAGEISQSALATLVIQIKKILRQAIKKGGTTLKDFVASDGKPGYFQQTLQVYGRGNHPCYRCGRLLHEIRLSGRTTVYCSYCQH